METEQPLLAATDLCCVRNERTLFQQLNFVLHPGQILQVAGPNGAGKSSLLRLLAGLARPEAGDVRWRGEQLIDVLESFRSELIYLGHQPGVKAELTPLESLAFYAPWTTEAERFDILATVGLVGHEDIPAGHLSAGQQRRIALARLFAEELSANPASLWILDEPLTAIDKQGVAELEQRFLRHTDNGGAILLTTHQDLHFARDRCQVLNLHDFLGAELHADMDANALTEAVRV